MIFRDMKLGTVTMLGENRTPAQAVVESTNMLQIKDGVWARKWGSEWYGTDLPSSRQGSPVITTNLCVNPSFETDTTGWGAVSGATLSQDAVEFYKGTKSLKVTKSGAVLEGVTSPTTANVTQSAFYTGSLYVKAPNALSITLQILHNATVKATKTITGNAAWQRITIAGLSGAVNAGVQLKLTWSTSDVVYIDAVQIEAGTDATDYFDGSLSDTNEDDYAWTGGAHASTSTRDRYVYAPYDYDGAFEVVNPDGSTEILEVAGGVIYRSSDGGAKTTVTLTDGTLTAGKKCFFLQIHELVYISNNYDPVVRYDTNTNAATGSTALSTPAAPTLAQTNLTGSNYTYYYVIVASNLIGTTVGSTEASQAVSKTRDDWQGVSGKITVTITRVTGASRYSIFIADQSGYEVYLDSVADPGSGTTFDYIDDGTIAPNDFVELPQDDTTGGLILGPMELSGNRIWAVQSDGAVVWGGVGQYQGVFSAFYGGGYVYLEKGGRERPVVPAHYRDGRGSATTTVFTTDPEGTGSTWQVSLETFTVGATSFIVPAPVKIVGSIGCVSPRGYAKVDNDIIFGNRKGAFSLGSQPNLLNVLATRELSNLIRDDWRNLNSYGMANVAMYYYDAKLFCAVPNGTSTNSEIWVRSSELRNWQLAWTGVAVQHFLEYTDSAGATHFMAVPVNGSKLIRLSPEVAGDFGAAFTTRLKTGQLPVNKNHNKFAQFNQIFLEVGKPVGNVRAEAYGYDYKKGFSSLATIDLEGSATSTLDWGGPWSSMLWSDVDTLPETTALDVVRKFKRINKLVNSLQFVIETTGLNDYYEWLESSASGFLVDVDPPRTWKQGSNTASIDRVSEDALLDEDGGTLLDEDGGTLLA